MLVQREGWEGGNNKQINNDDTEPNSLLQRDPTSTRLLPGGVIGHTKYRGRARLSSRYMFGEKASGLSS